MKIMTVLGTRPEIIRLSVLIKKLDESAQHVLVHTGQNFDESLSDIFFRDLGVRKPDYLLNIAETRFGEQVGRIISETESIMRKENPDRLLILGDTNSGLAALPAKRLGIPVYHMEAGNRCYDDRVPEEINRRVIDHLSDVLMPYTHRSKENLVREGIERKRVFVIGNPINEVLDCRKERIRSSTILESLRVQPHGYFLITMHRAENVDNEVRLTSLVRALELLSEEHKMPIICSLHPRTRSKMQQFGLSIDRRSIQFLTPLGFFDFVALEQDAFCVLSDSGTVQEECCLLRVPNVTIRDVTERPETIECGSNILSGCSPEVIQQSVRLVAGNTVDWSPPSEYLEKSSSAIVMKILLGFKSSL